MSSQIHHAEDLEAALVYAPPWAREQASLLDGGPRVVPAGGQPRTLNIGSARRAFTGDRAMLELQRQRALNPDKVPDPSQENARNLWPLMRRLCAIIGVAVVVAGGVVSLPAMRKVEREAMPSGGSPMPIAAKQIKVDEVRSATAVPALVENGSTAAIQAPADATLPVPKSGPISGASNPMTNSAIAPAVPGQTSGSAPDSGASVPPTHESAPASAPSAAGGGTVRLADEEIAMLVKRGKDFFMNGDMSSARLLLIRAAAAGSAEAALVLGKTFDPLVIRRMGVIGMEVNIARARQWYQKAAELGSAAASQQLKELE